MTRGQSKTKSIPCKCPPTNALPLEPVWSSVFSLLFGQVGVIVLMGHKEEERRERGGVIRGSMINGVVRVSLGC